MIANWGRFVFLGIGLSLLQHHDGLSRFLAGFAFGVVPFMQDVVTSRQIKAQIKARDLALADRLEAKLRGRP